VERHALLVKDLGRLLGIESPKMDSMCLLPPASAIAQTSISSRVRAVRRTGRPLT